MTDEVVMFSTRAGRLAPTVTSHSPGPAHARQAVPDPGGEAQVSGAHQGAGDGAVARRGVRSHSTQRGWETVSSLQSDGGRRQRGAGLRGARPWSREASEADRASG